MESKSDALEQLETLYHQAASQSERNILLQTMRIVNPEEGRRLEEIIQREHVRDLPFEEVVALIASHKGMTTDDARKAVADLVFDQLLDHAKLEALVAQAKTPSAAPAHPPAASVRPSRIAAPSAPRAIPQVPVVQIIEPPKEPVPMPGSEERASAEGPAEPAADPPTAKPGGGFLMPRNIPQE